MSADRELAALAIQVAAVVNRPDTAEERAGALEAFRVALTVELFADAPEAGLVAVTRASRLWK